MEFKQQCLTDASIYFLGNFNQISSRLKSRGIMQEKACQILSKKRLFRKESKSLLDERTVARLNREDLETWKGLSNLKKEKKLYQKKSAELSQEDRRETAKQIEEDETRLAEESKDVEVAKEPGKRSHYRFTRWSKLKMLRLRKEREKWEEYFEKYKRCKFLLPLIKFKVILSHQEWNRTCHSKERRAIREKIHLENISRIRWEYDIDEALPADSVVFKKYEEERKERSKLRHERTIMIVKKIVREMDTGIRLPKKRKYRKKFEVEEICEESFEEISFEEVHSQELPTMQESFQGSTSKFPEEEQKVEKMKEEKEVEKKEEEFLSEVDLKKSRSSIEQVFPRDTCFFAIPSAVIFEDFQAGKVYSRKVAIRNKTAKWAYLRFHRIHTEVWEPGIVEIDIMDAARVKPGLHVTINVKFSPIHEEEVTAEISFLTLNPDDTKNFHEFRVSVRCTPQTALPVLDPKEVRFPSAPIWKYDDRKLNERILTVSNEGAKSCSVVIEERNNRENCFWWFCDQADLESAKSSISCINENENGEINEKSGKKYQIEIPPTFKCNLRITFRPKYVGLHHEVLEICFLSEDRTLGKQSVPVWTEVTGYPIHLDPPCIDLGIATIDSDVCQQSFNIVNTGRSNTEILTKTPKYLGNQVSVHPKSTIVQSESFSTVAVRLIPETNIVNISKRFYDRLSNMLEFPLQVQIISQDQENPPPLILKVLATLTTCHALVLEPAHVDLGYVCTHESVNTEITLTNESLLTQKYAFLNLPAFMEIQPNYGFGAILPGETIKLDLIYSACLTDIPGNEIGANGLFGERRLSNCSLIINPFTAKRCTVNSPQVSVRKKPKPDTCRVRDYVFEPRALKDKDESFCIKAVTLAELAGNKKQKILNKLMNQLNRETVIPRARGLPPPLSVNLKVPKTLQFALDNEETADVSLEKLGYLDERKEKNTIDLSVYIVDTFCELSEQIIEFPATPCGSYSVASVHLRGFNMASYPNCTCGIVKSQQKEFTARYEFKTSSDRIKIVPQCGTLQSSELIQVNFMFEPRLPKNLISEEGLKLRMNIEEQEAKSEKDEKSTQKAGEIRLLETFEPRIATIFITCMIELEMKNGSKYDELLFAKLTCPITRPEILILNENREINFGSTAIDTSSRKFLLIKNISTRNVKIEVSLLDPFGPFFVAPGKTIETGSILKLPVTYKPTENHKEEVSHFEI
ncbi:hypothetical protein WH47_06319 [Habropoda laboriosa]|uniref:Uncharacterized protein n=1 Tax=Habropoda laboriosa TaxID=597456 RepID=A0A0L7RCG3_9HYME|nr:hypothetical protein WH47_06319 [Habropoda laboriosa]